MKLFRKFLGLAAAEQFLLVGAISLLASVRIILWLLPFKIVKRIWTKCALTQSGVHAGDQFSADRAVWAIQVASRYVPRTTCLTKALAAQALLRLCGISAAIRIGVAKHTEGNLEAHAWLESDGKILIGGADAHHEYKLLISFGAVEHQAQ